MTDWIKYLPSGLPQFLQQDTNACSDYAPIDAIESYELFLTGQQQQYSRRWLAYMSGTDPIQGNSEWVILPIIKKYGLVLESSWPQTSNMTSAEFYTPPTPDEQTKLLAEGEAWLQKWEVLDNYNVPFTDISQGPLIARLNLQTTFHFIEVLNANWYYDSEFHSGKIGVTPPFGTVADYYQILIKERDQVMLVFFQVKNNPTLWILDQGQWVGFSDMPTFTNYVNGRPFVQIELDQVEFQKLTINPNVHKS